MDDRTRLAALFGPPSLEELAAEDAPDEPEEDVPPMSYEAAERILVEVDRRLRDREKIRALVEGPDPMARR